MKKRLDTPTLLCAQSLRSSEQKSELRKQINFWKFQTIVAWICAAILFSGYIGG